jgi:hypothetical protein
MTTCTYCQKELSFLTNITRPSVHQTRRCADCNTLLSQWQNYWMNALDQDINTSQGVTAELEQAILNDFNQRRVPPEIATPVLDRLHYFRSVTRIRQGHISAIHVSMHLDSDERAYFEYHSTYYKPNKIIKVISGRLIGTNKKCYFISNTGQDSVTLDWNNVSHVDRRTIQAPAHTYKQNGRTYTQYQSVNVIHLSVTRGSGGGSYSVSDPFYAKTLIDTLVDLWKRQLVFEKENSDNKIIPQHVRKEVYVRDNGRCVQCGARNYLEYDHILPHSLGGANTTNNVQLLCRKCNAQKGVRI